MSTTSVENGFVGLVLVSHSASIAEGLAELVAQVAGPQVTIVAIGGATDGSLGTDGGRVLDALRKGGFPASKMDVGSQAVTIGVGHLCCGGCKAGLASALKASKVEELNADAIKIGEDSVTIKAKEGMSLDRVPVLTAMEKGGFSAKSIMIGASTASIPSPHRRLASVHSVQKKAVR